MFLGFTQRGQWLKRVKKFGYFYEKKQASFFIEFKAILKKFLKKVSGEPHGCVAIFFLFCFN